MSRVAVVPSARALVLVASLVFLAVQGDDVVSCQNPSQQSGTCIVITDCPEMMALLLKTDITEDENEFLNNSKCRAHDYLLYMCCPSEPVRLPKPAVVQEEGPDDAPIPANPLIPTLGECGKYTENKTGEGESMDLTEFPWLALLQYTEPTEKAFLCGGSLISARYVLTAAHCVTKPLVTSTNRLTSVRLGEYNKTSERDCVGNVCSDNPLDIPVEHSLAHKDFNFSDRSNDIALVRLSRSVEYSAWVAPICLPLLSDVITRKNRVSEELTAGGWGYTEIDGSSDVKMKIKLSVVSRDSCANVYRYVNERVLNTQLCARRREETCRGDFGAPLVALEEQGADVNWFLAGIVSDGTMMCGMWTWPWLIIDVTKYGAWIARNIKP